MTGQELKQLREDLGEELGRSISVADMAKICGMSPNSGPDQIRKWERGDGPSGPVTVLLSILACASDRHMMHPEVNKAGVEVFTSLLAPRPFPELVFHKMIRAEVLRRLN